MKTKSSNTTKPVKVLKTRGRKPGQLSLVSITLQQLVDNLPKTAKVVIGAKWAMQLGIVADPEIVYPQVGEPVTNVPEVTTSLKVTDPTEEFAV